MKYNNRKKQMNKRDMNKLIKHVNRFNKQGSV